MSIRHDWVRKDAAAGWECRHCRVEWNIEATFPETCSSPALLFTPEEIEAVQEVAAFHRADGFHESSDMMERIAEKMSAPSDRREGDK